MQKKVHSCKRRFLCCLLFSLAANKEGTSLSLTNEISATAFLGATNVVVALSQTEVAKRYVEDKRSDIGSEAEKMKFANRINGLVVQFTRLDYNPDLIAEMLVMERLYPIDYHAYQIKKRELWFDVFEDEIKQLHKAGLVHRDLKCLLH